MENSLYDELTENGYTDLKEIDGKGVCGIHMMAYTFGLHYGMDMFGYKGRYCYHTAREARQALSFWDGIGSPSGNWIKHKGEGVDDGNPDYEKQSAYTG